MGDNKETTTAVEAAIKPDRVKKISLASFGGGRKPSDEEHAGAGAFMGTIVGKATGFRSTETVDVKTGEAVQHLSVTGQFFATLANGSVLASGTLYLPDGFQQDMLDIVAPIDVESGERKNSGNEITFSYDVFCDRSSSAAGYAYRIVPLVERRKGGGDDLYTQIKAAREQARTAVANEKALALAGPAKKK